jgi:hypothetical protein
MRPPHVGCSMAKTARAAILVGAMALLGVLPAAASAQTPACPDLPAAEDGFSRLWDGKTITGWSQSGPGGFEVVNDGAEGCRLESRGGLGLFWYSARTYADYVVKLQWKTTRATDNSGLFVRFPNPGTDPFVAVDRGYELQIREGVTGDGEDQKTGSIYNTKREIARAAKPVGQWNDYEISVVGHPARITIKLNGTLVQDFTSSDWARAKPGYVGLQNHGSTDFVSFRDIRIKDLGGLEPSSGLFDSVGITAPENRGWSQIHGSPSNYSYPSDEMPAAGTFGPGGFQRTGAGGPITVPLRMPDTAGKAPNVASFSGQTLDLRAADRGVYSKAHFFGFTADGSGGGDVTFKYAGGEEEKARVAFDDWGCQEAAANTRRTVIRARFRRSTTSTGAPGGIGFCIYHVEIPLTKALQLEQIVLPTSTTPVGRWAAAYLLGVTFEGPVGNFVAPDLKGADKWAPTTTQSLTPGTPDGFKSWYTAAPTVALTADDFGGSELDRLEYREGRDWTAYTAPFKPAGSGTHVIEYRATDKAGNAKPGSLTVKVDGTAPVTTATVDGATLTLDAADEDGGSGLDAIVYRVEDADDDDASDWNVYDGPVTFDKVGEHTITYLAADNAGNAEAARTATVTVTAPPPSGGSGSPPAGGDSKTPAPGRDAPAPLPGAWLNLDTPGGKRSLAAFRTSGMRVAIRCVGAKGATATLKVKRKTARRLGLKKTTLAAAAIACEPGAEGAVRLKAGKQVRRALAKSKGSMRATLRVATTGAKSVSDSASLVFQAGR